MRHLTLILLVAYSSIGFSEEVYKDVDEEGVPSFSDQQMPGSETIEIEPPVTFSTPKQFTRQTEQKLAPGDHKPANYQIMITDPPNNAAIRENSGLLALSITIKPNLRATHTGELIMDGIVIRNIEGSGPVVLSNVDRGTHSFNVQVVDPKGVQIDEGSPVSITMQRHAVKRASPR